MARAAAPGTTFMVAVEGLPVRGQDGALFGGVPASSLRYALLSAQLRDGVHVVHTEDTAATAALVRLVAAKMEGLQRGGADAGAEQPGGMRSILRAVALPRHGEGLTRRGLAEAQLSLAPGVSRAAAAALLGEHETLPGWVAALAADPRGPVAALAEARVTPGGRRLDGRAAERLTSLMLSLMLS
jgi:hypothetical protein